MRFFFTSEVDAIVGDKIRIVRNAIENKIKIEFSSSNYGSAIIYWAHIIICCAPEVYQAGFFKEIKKYTVKKNDIELRLRIDYESMVKASNEEAYKLICESVLRGIDIAEHELKVQNFNFAEFRKDIKELFQKEGWI